MQKNIEQCYAIKFCVRRKKTKKEPYRLLKEAYGDEQMSQASFYRWFNKFSETNEKIEDEPRSEAPRSARKEGNIQEVQRLMMCFVMPSWLTDIHNLANSSRVYLRMVRLCV